MCNIRFRRHWRFGLIVVAALITIKVVVFNGAYNLINSFFLLFSYNPLKVPECLSCGHSNKFLWSSFSMRGRRDSMEDRHDVVNSSTVASYAVFDGHGGEKCSSEAKGYLLKSIVNDLTNCDDKCDTNEIIKTNVLKFDEIFLQSQIGSFQQSGNFKKILNILFKV